MPKTYYYARPHALWKMSESGPILKDGKLQTELDENGKAKVRFYTLAIGDGKDHETKLESAPPMKWIKFKLKREATNFIMLYGEKIN
jgi:hypothetical protein